MYYFSNIDDYVPERFETMGMLKGKRWYSQNGRKGLFKPQRQEFGDRKVFCGNHYGEFIGYLLTLNIGVDACEAELAHLTKYFPNIHKERNHGTPVEKDGCITYSDLAKNERLEHGKLLVERFFQDHTKEYASIISKNRSRMTLEDSDNIEIVLAAIEYRIRDFYKKNTNISSEELENRIKEEKKKMISCIVYDCLYGNNDRHDENWAMRVDVNGNYIGLYPLYDNERVLGLYENQRNVTEALKNGTVEETSDRILFSRMSVPGDKNKFSNYKDVLEYMLEHYGEETAEALQMNLEKNTPELIYMYLDSCEKLPECYKEFSKKVFASRREFAKDLIRRKSNREKESSVEEL